LLRRTKAPDTNLYKILYKIFIPDPQIVIEGPPRGSYKIFLEEPPQSIPQELSDKHL